MLSSVRIYFLSNPYTTTLHASVVTDDRLGSGLHVIRKKLRRPRKSWTSFEILAQTHIFPSKFAGKLQGMVGFRNVLVHEYQRLDIDILVDVIEHRLDDLIAFSNYVIKYLHGR